MRTSRRQPNYRQHLCRPLPPFAALFHGIITCAGGFTGANVESEMVSPAPIGYAGGIRIGSLPRTGDQPSSARAAARSAGRTPLRAIRYDFTVGVWFSR